MKPILIQLILLVACILSTRLSFARLHEERQQSANAHEEMTEVLYLPQGRALRALSFGYRNALSNLLWFKTISYFGKHYHSDEKYAWLGHMCKLVTDLNPGETQIFDFCGLMLAWEAGQPEKSIDILTKAIEAHPQSWRFYYLRGFNYMFFLKDNDKARDDFVSASKLPDAIPYMLDLAKRMISNTQSPDDAIAFFSDMIKRSKDPTERTSLEKRLKEAQHEKNFQLLEKAMAFYEQKYGHKADSLETLQKDGVISSIGADPFGGQYYFDAPSGEFKSTSKVRRLAMRSKHHGGDNKQGGNTP